VTDRQQLEQAIAAQEALRGVVPDDVVDAAVAALVRQLHTSAGDAERRRQVTVLFADVSGFTALSSQLDPEAVARVMNDLWSALDAIVRDHGGHVDKHIGDAVMAVWGMTASGEDDPERAVRAGLAMQHEVLGRRSRQQLTMRVGISTGPAHIGAVGASTEITAIGDAVNVASRVQAVAPLGGVLVTHDTYRHIRGVFDVQPLDPVAVKGKDEPIRIYVVQRAKERAFRMPTRGVEGIETRMIGRAHELATLQAEFERVLAAPVGRRVTIIGDAGVGKSRLLDEFENWIDLHRASAYFFKGRALATRRAVPFGLTRDVFGDRFGVLDSDPPSRVAEKLRTGFGPTLAPAESDVVGHWLGFDLRSSPAVQALLGSGELAATARAHLCRYVEALGIEGPVVMFLEDLHWADDESLLLIDDLVAQLGEARLLVVGAARPTLLERPEAAPGLDQSPVVLRLEPLEPSAARGLVAEILRPAGAVPDDLAELIVERTDGNAFYVEELVKMLIEDGVIEIGELSEPWRIHAERLDPDRVPATLTGVLQTRLDSLSRGDRDALQRSSVVGRVFWNGTVASLGTDGIPATTRSLEVARQRELVFRRDRSSFEDSVEYVFKHALLRDVTYETVLLRDRQRLHRLVARWITDHAGERLTEYAGLIATHHRLAGDLAAAADLLHQSAAASLDAGNCAAVRRALTEAFELWDASGRPLPVSALCTMAEACIRLGDLQSARRFCDDALEADGIPSERAAALYLRGWLASEEGDYERERELLSEALPEAERHGGVLLARVLAGLSWSAIVRGEMDEARTLAAHANEIADEIGNPRVVRQAASLLGVIAGASGDVEGSLVHAHHTLAIAVEAGDLDGQAISHANLGVAFHLLGDAHILENDPDAARAQYVVALDHYAQAGALARRLGRQVSWAMNQANVGQIHIRLGDEKAARRAILGALEAADPVGATPTLMFCILAEADRRLTNGEITSALELLGFVQQHPARNFDSQSEVQRILARVDLPAETIREGLERDVALDLDGVVRRLLHELAEPDLEV
jgi:class 3 adenylate cyclase/tetratricopeptide (TPR) repeat protein